MVNRIEAKADKVRDLAQARFGALLPAERKLIRAAVNANEAVCGPNDRDDDPNNNPKDSKTWRPDRRIRAEVLRWLCVDSRARDCVDPDGIAVHGARIDGALNLSYARVPFPLRLWVCRLTEFAYLHSTQIPMLDLRGSWVASLQAEGATVAGDVFLHRVHADGEVNLMAAQIGGDFDCGGARLYNSPAKRNGGALVADGISVKGNLFLNVVRSEHVSTSFHASGEVRLLGAQIGRNLDCRGGEFINPQSGFKESGEALSADGISVGGTLSLSDGFSAEGEVRLIDARIGTNLDCTRGKFVNPQKREGVGEMALNAERAEVKGDVMLINGFSANGTVSLAGTRVLGNVDCRNGKATTLVLERTSAGSIMDDEGSWPAHGNLYLDGFVYGRIVSGHPKNRVLDDAETRLRWLNLQPDTPFAPQPYLQLAKVLREGGDDDGARRVLIEMEDRQWNHKKDPHWIDPVQRWPLKLTVGYGYQPLWAFWEVLGLSALGWIISRRCYLAGSIVPTDKEAYQSFKAEGQPPPHYNTFAPLVYSIEKSLPLVNLGQADKWQPDPSPAPLSSKEGRTTRLGQTLTWPRFLGWLQRFLVLLGLQVPSNLEQKPSRVSRWCTSPKFLRWFLWAQILLGWLLATLFLAGVSGIVRR